MKQGDSLMINLVWISKFGFSADNAAAAVFPGSYWDGKIHEVIIFDGILPQRVYTQIANYLTIK